MTRWSILYRGPLSSCNYGCIYCPFAKTVNSAAELREDARQLERFVDWVETRPENIGVLFTPWGEALFHRAYQQAIIRLSHMRNVWKVAIQTNLSGDLNWLSSSHAPKVGLWTTYHPSQTNRPAFLRQCKKLDQLSIPHSVGVVGFKDQLGEIRAMRRELPCETYLWINAFKREASYYSENDLRNFEEVDPLFRINSQYHPSRGEKCQAGSSVFSVDGDGTMRRCHFIKEPIGNIYTGGLEQMLAPKPCSNATCGCHIGYVHLEPLNLYQVFGDGLLERIPKPEHWKGALG
ncbi:hypothetical protein BH09VER1_BH09VER1_45410 [soil metagenome]